MVGYEARQVCDMPAIHIAVTAHRAERKRCPPCGSTTTGACPPGVAQAVPYGLEVQTWAVYFTKQHHLPVDRTTQIFEDLVHQPVSEATVLKASEDVSSCIDPSREAVQELVRDGEVWRSQGFGSKGNCLGCLWPAPTA